VDARSAIRLPSSPGPASKRVKDRDKDNERSGANRCPSCVDRDARTARRRGPCSEDASHWRRSSNNQRTARSAAATDAALPGWIQHGLWLETKMSQPRGDCRRRLDRPRRTAVRSSARYSSGAMIRAKGSSTRAGSVPGCGSISLRTYYGGCSRRGSTRCRSTSRRRVRLASARRWCCHGVHRVRAELVVAVKYPTWTDSGLLRQVVYEGIREDKPAREVVRSHTSAA
jgi:hypothetical protein